MEEFAGKWAGCQMTTIYFCLEENILFFFISYTIIQKVRVLGRMNTVNIVILQLTVKLFVCFKYEHVCLCAHVCAYTCMCLHAGVLTHIE